MTGISIFDLDRTLTIRPTYSAFLLYALVRTAPWRFVLIPTLAVFAFAYLMRVISRRHMKEAMHRVALGKRVNRPRIERVAADFACRIARKGIFPQAHDLLAKQRSEGRRLILATAAPSLYAEPIATYLGIDDVIASQNRWQNDDLFAEMTGENCYAIAKREFISAWLRSERISREVVHIAFFSDHISDLPTFEWADMPVAVNPSRALRTIAQARGWAIVDWRRRVRPWR